MPDTEQPEAKATDAAPSTKRERWYRRPTVRALKKQAEIEDREFTQSWDLRENDATRLPESESVHLGGVVLTEAFTPSTVSSLFKVLESWPTDRESQRAEWINALARSRSGHHGGWQNLGLVRPPGAFIMGDGCHDPDLPSGVNAVWLHVSYVTPTLAMAVATFTLSDSAADLSSLLRRDYQTRHFDTRLRIPGRLGRLRAQIPWARPARHGIGYSISHAEGEKRAAYQLAIGTREAACSQWFFEKFRGRFAAAQPQDRPIIRMVFTEEKQPYAERHADFRPAGLDFAIPLWRSSERDGWWLASNGGVRDDGHHSVTLAARRSDVAEPPTEGESGHSNWFLTQAFGSAQAPFAARLAMPALLDLYAQRLARLRDRAASRPLVARPVRDARNLDEYLIGDGLDAATIASDLELLTRDLDYFRWEVPEFAEYRDHLGGPSVDRAPAEYVPALCHEVREQAQQLASDATTTTTNIRASAELRQAIANTRLQRIVLVLSVCAIVVAVISLLLNQT